MKDGNRTIKKILLSTVLLLVVVHSHAYAQFKVESIQAAFIYRFTDFITWPTNARDNFYVCVAGSSKLYSAVSKMVEGKEIKSKGVVTLSEKDFLHKNQYCHILILGKIEKGSKLGKQVIKKSKDTGQMVISCNESNSDLAIIKLKVKDKKLAFDVNHKLSKKNGFKISSKLLRLADKVD